MSTRTQNLDIVENDPQAVAPELVVIPAGEFFMGETAEDKFATDTERPTHRVSIKHSFALGKFPVTEAEFEKFVSSESTTSVVGRVLCPPVLLAPNMAGLKPAPQWRTSFQEPGDDLPVVNVSWDDARDYCAWLSAETGKLFRLPTEAEWEYACRAGTRTPFGTGNDITLAEANFLYTENGERVGPGERVSVRQGSANRFGVCGLHGNVCEWVEDSWHPNYEGAPTDGAAWVSGGDPMRCVIRGGAWDYLPRLLRSAWRDGLPKQCRRDNVGFRVALTIEGS
jgi:formylglycine-generating enzyme required for sulfatase activity